MRTPWGQNFLVSPGISEKIAAALGGDRHTPVVEIGPGRGALTDYLAARYSHLTLVELDSSLASVLARRWSMHESIQVVNADFLQWPLPQGNTRMFHVIGNLPYSAAAAIVQKVLAWSGWARAVFMVQKEVARRMCAVPGGKEWGLLALSVQTRAKARRLFDVPPGAFRPVPKVDSTVVELVPLSASVVDDMEAFFRVARAAFSQRRKTVANSLAHGLELDGGIVSSALAAAGVEGSRRPETLSIAEFGCLASLLNPR